MTPALKAQNNTEKSLVTEVFEGQSLIEVIKLMQKKYHLKVAYERKLVKSYQVHALIQQQPLEQAWEKILSATPLTCLMLGGGKVVIRRNYTQASFVVNQESKKSENQTYTYAAIVKDSETGERIPYATVSIAGTSIGTVANQEGFFSLSNLSSLQDSLVISHLGYTSSVLRLEGQQQGNKEVRLKSSMSMMQEIEVIDKPFIGLVAYSKKSGQHIINPESTASMPQIGEKDIFRNLQLLPGISIAHETSAKLAIRGSSTDQNLVLFDGFTIYHLDHLYGFFSSLNSDAIKDIRLYKGGFDAKYGGRASSVIDISGKSGNQYQPSANLGLNLLSANLKAETPLGERGSALIAFRRSYTDVLQTDLFNTLVRYADHDMPPLVAGAFNPRNEEKEAFYYYDTNVKLSYRPTDTDRISLSVYQGADDYNQKRSIQIAASNIAYQESIGESNRLANTGIGLSWSHIWNEQLYSNFSLGYSHYQTQYTLNMTATEGEANYNSTDALMLQRENTLDEYSAKLDFEYTISPQHELDFGAFSTANEIMYNDQNLQREQYSNIVDQGLQSGVYVNHIYRPLDKLEVNTGLRSTYYSPLQQVYWEPRLSANYALQEGLSLKASVGRYNQFINKANSDLSLNIDQDFWLMADSEQIPVLSSVQYMGGFSYFTKDWALDAEVYYKDINGLIMGGYDSYVDASGTRPYWNFDRVITGGNSQVKGLDIMLSRNWEHNSSTVSYSLSQAVQQFEEINEGTSFFADGDQRHTFKLSSQWNFNPWNFALNWMYGSGQPYSAPTEIAYENGFTRLIYNEKNNNRLPAYHRMDVSASYSFKVGKGEANVGFSIFNLYDQQNIGNRSFLFDRFGMFQRERSPRVIQLVSIDQLLLERTLSIFLNINF